MVQIVRSRAIPMIKKAVELDPKNAEVALLTSRNA